MREFLFEIPARFVLPHDFGQVQRYGALLKDVNTGRIVAHLQETGLGQSLVSRALQTSGAILKSPLQPLGLVGNVAQIVQNEQIKHALAVLQQFQIANLVLSGVGIGVSAAGFAVTNMKIERLRAGLDKIGSAVDRLANDMNRHREDSLDRDLSRLDTACRQMDEAWLLGDPERQWQDAAMALHERQGDFHVMAMRVRERQGVQDELFGLLVEAWLLATSARITARMAAGEMEAAVAAAREATRAARALTGGIDDTDLMSPEALRLPEAAYRLRVAEARQLTQGFREREDLIESKVLLIRHLVERGIPGRSYLEAARNEPEEPILLLPTDRRN